MYIHYIFERKRIPVEVGMEYQVVTVSDKHVSQCTESEKTRNNEWPAFHEVVGEMTVHYDSQNQCSSEHAEENNQVK